MLPTKNGFEKLKGEIVATLVSDLHLQPKAPTYRSVEDSWFEAMQRPLDEIKSIQETFECPIVYGGDIFDKWNAPPEVINFALKYLPDGYAVPGNHDLKYHNWDDLKKTAFWTLVKAGKITLLKPNKPLEVGDVVLHGFPYGTELHGCNRDSHTFAVTIAVVHQFVWTKDTGFTGADPSNRLKNIRSQLPGYDILHFGDNHKTFLVGNAFNPGSLMIRNADQKDHRPCVGLVKRNHEIVIHYLNCSKDKYMEITPSEEKTALDMSKFIEGMEHLDVAVVDFQEVVKRWLDSNQVSDGVKKVILKCCEKKDD